jgi:hypothetical protein
MAGVTSSNNPFEAMHQHLRLRNPLPTSGPIAALCADDTGESSRGFNYVAA